MGDSAATQAGGQPVVALPEIDITDPHVTSQLILTEFANAIHNMFSEAANVFGALDEEEAAFQQQLQFELATQEEKGRQLRAQIERAQQSIQLFMRSLPSDTPA